MIAKVIAAMIVGAIVLVMAVLIGPLVSLIPFLLGWNFVATSIPQWNLPYLDWVQALAILVAAYAFGGAIRSTLQQSR